MSATTILVLGPSGSGKSTSWRTVPYQEAFIIKPNSKRLPFPGSVKQYTTETNVVITSELNDIPKLLTKISNKMPNIKYVLIDDNTHFQNARMMSQSFMNDNSNAGFGKWNKFGADVFNAITGTAELLRDDLIIVYMHHTDIKADGTHGFKSSGQLLDNIIDPVSYFTYVLHAFVERDATGKAMYKFYTNDPGNKIAKTPMGMFDDLTIDNDMFEVIKRIEKYNNGEI